MCGNDIFNRRAVLGFLKSQRIDKNTLIGNRFTDTFEFSKNGVRQLLF